MTAYRLQSSSPLAQWDPGEVPHTLVSSHDAHDAVRHCRTYAFRRGWRVLDVDSDESVTELRERAYSALSAIDAQSGSVIAVVDMAVVRTDLGGDAFEDLLWLARIGHYAGVHLLFLVSDERRRNILPALSRYLDIPYPERIGDTA